LIVPLVFSNVYFYFERHWRRLFQTQVMRTKLHIYVNTKATKKKTRNLRDKQQGPTKNRVRTQVLGTRFESHNIECLWEQITKGHKHHRHWRRLFQTQVMRTKLHIYVFTKVIRIVSVIYYIIIQITVTGLLSRT
jgi:hypothetical protein